MAASSSAHSGGVIAASALSPSLPSAPPASPKISSKAAGDGEEEKEVPERERKRKEESSVPLKSEV